VIRSLRAFATSAQVVTLGREMAMESRFARLGYDDERAAAHALRMLTDPAYIGYGVFEGGDLVGFISGTCGRHLPFSDAIVAHQQLLFISPSHRAPFLAARLIQAFIADARARGARDITFSNGTGYEPERVGKLFEICGLSRVGGLYVMEA
jgi:GNAT superfamily N-acetyltransferase